MMDSYDGTAYRFLPAGEIDGQASLSATVEDVQILYNNIYCRGYGLLSVTDSPADKLSMWAMLTALIPKPTLYHTRVSFFSVVQLYISRTMVILLAHLSTGHRELAAVSDQYTE